jgi:AAT family amino acid transporter
MSIIKVATIVVMIILGLAMIILGLGNGWHPVGFSNLVSHGGLFPKGFSGWSLSLVLVAFAFGGVESVGVTSAEALDVKKSIPKAINGVFWRIMIFYVGAIFVIVTLYDWSDVGSSGSPFVQVFSKIGIPAAASIINLVVLTAGISGMNSSIYITTRYAYNLSLQGHAPSVFHKLNKQNVPSLGVIIVFVLQLVGVFINYLMPASAFSVFSSIVVTLLISGWLAILISQLNFRRIKRAQGEPIEFKMPWWPYSNYFAIAVMIFVVIMMWRLPFTRVALYVFPVELVILLFIYAFTRNRFVTHSTDDEEENADIPPMP